MKANLRKIGKGRPAADGQFQVSSFELEGPHPGNGSRSGAPASIFFLEGQNAGEPADFTYTPCGKGELNQRLPSCFGPASLISAEASLAFSAKFFSNMTANSRALRS